MFRARWNESGHEVTQTQQVQVTPGDHVNVQFPVPPTTAGPNTAVIPTVIPPAYVNAVFLPVIFVSGVFYDAAKAPGFIKGIAQALPLKHLIDGLSGAMVKGTGLATNISALGVIAAWAVLGIALAVRGFSWEQRRS